MIFIRVSVCLCVFLLLMCSPVQSSDSSDLKYLKQHYKELNEVVNNPNLYIPPEGYWPNGRPEIWTRQKLKEKVIESLILKKGKYYTVNDFKNELANVLTACQLTENYIKHEYLPRLEDEIRSKTAALNQSRNGSDSNIPGTFDKLVDEDHLAAISFNNMNKVIKDNSCCPMTNPGDKKSYKLYPNGQSSGRTFLLCKYSGNGYLQLEQPWVNGKVDGLVTNYRFDKKSGIHYWSERANWSCGKRDGITENYKLSKSGAVYRLMMTTYADGKKHGDSAQWYDNGQTKLTVNYFQGDPTVKYNYKRDGSLAYCTKWGSDRRPRDCKTGKLR